MSKKKVILPTEESKDREPCFSFKPKTRGQAQYLSALKQNIVTFNLGPAGTGKTACSLALASKQILCDEIDSIVIARPAIEASKKGLGHLPGLLAEKIAPYLIPAISHLEHFLGKSNYDRLFKEGRIKYEALEYMRGMTYDHSFMCLEEAQNTTYDQLVMFISRIGRESKVVISGDPEQNDLGVYPGFTDLERLIDKVVTAELNGFSVVRMTVDDIVRHPIIGDFLKVVR